VLARIFSRIMLTLGKLIKRIEALGVGSMALEPAADFQHIANCTPSSDGGGKDGDKVVETSSKEWKAIDKQRERELKYLPTYEGNPGAKTSRTDNL
jgi:hypothetical protein